MATLRSFNIVTLVQSQGIDHAGPNSIEMLQRGNGTYEIWFTGNVTHDEKTIMRTSSRDAAEIVYDSIKAFVVATGE